MAAMSTAMNSTTSDGQRRAIIKPVIAGTSSSQGDMQKVRCSATIKWLTLPSPETCMVSPAKKNIVSEMTKAGTVVFIIYRMWVKRGVPVTLDASTVVSDKGDNLSPK